MPPLPPHRPPARRPGRPALAALLLAASGCSLAVPSRYVATHAAESSARPDPVPPARAAAPPSAAARVAPAAPRSLADLLDAALASDPATRAAWHEARSAAATSGSRRGAYLPAVDVEGFFERHRTPATEGPDAGTSTRYGASASLQWLLLDLGARAAAIREGDLLLAAASLGHRAAVLDLVLRVHEGYWGYLGATSLVAAQGASVRQAETSLAAAEDRRRAGVATIADVLQARTALSQARLTLQQLEGDAATLRGALATAAGLPPTTELDVGELPARPALAAAQPRVDALLDEAAATNPELSRARALADAAGARAVAVSRSGLPQLLGQAGASRSFRVEPDGPDPRADAWSAGLVLRIPLFEGLRSAYDARAAREAAEAARARAAAAGQQVYLDVWSSFQAVRTAERRVETSRDLLESAGASADVAQARYKEGVGSILDVLNAQSALALARAEEVRARADWFLSVARLARSTGRLEPGPGAAPPPAGEERP